MPARVRSQEDYSKDRVVQVNALSHGLFLPACLGGRSRLSLPPPPRPGTSRAPPPPPHLPRAQGPRGRGPRRAAAPPSVDACRWVCTKLTTCQPGTHDMKFIAGCACACNEGEVCVAVLCMRRCHQARQGDIQRLVGQVGSQALRRRGRRGPAVDHVRGRACRRAPRMFFERALMAPRPCIFGLAPSRLGRRSLSHCIGLSALAGGCCPRCSNVHACSLPPSPSFMRTSY